MVSLININLPKMPDFHNVRGQVERYRTQNLQNLQAQRDLDHMVLLRRFDRDRRNASITPMSSEELLSWLRLAIWLLICPFALIFAIGFGAMYPIIFVVSSPYQRSMHQRRFFNTWTRIRNFMRNILW